MEEEMSDSFYSSPNQYALPTFGLSYPGFEEPESNPFIQFFRPVQFKNEVLSSSERKVIATLQNEDMWKLFMEVGNEMMVTKPGR